MIPAPDSWVTPCPPEQGGGLWVEPGGFHVDPTRAVDRAVITHGHSDHARPGHAHVLATPGTLAIMRARLGDGAGAAQQPLPYHQPIRIGEVTVRLVPAGHVLGSAQVVMEWRGSRVVVSGDYKRRFDPTCAPFEPVPCDAFITEATFGLPVFRHPPVEGEIARLLHTLSVFPERTIVVGCYALGKCQRLIAELRRAGYDRPLHLHGAHLPLCALYQEQGVELGDLRPATVADASSMRGGIVLAPPSAMADKWLRRMPDPLPAYASGWMRVRARARQHGVELPLIVSDHADWDELCQTVTDVAPGELWVTHGSEEALVHWATTQGVKAKPLHLIGRGEEE
ncbi:hypothetical protein IP70_00595 [alpha proteobacterium AAP38]|nr:hypothetical protein IP70_00595 [alpha proteobacterium AAP38]